MTADEVKKIVSEHLLVNDYNDVGGGYSAILDTRAELDALECRIHLYRRIGQCNAWGATKEDAVKALKRRLKAI